MVAGDFLDFLVAIVCLILVLRAHKIIRHFLDMLIPGGPGPGGLGHAMMEGLGFAVGGKIASGAVQAGKTAVAFGTSAGIGGVAAVAQNRAAAAAMPKLGSGVSAVGGQAMGSANSRPALYPGSLPSGSKATALLGDGNAKPSPGYGTGDGFTFRDMDQPQVIDMNPFEPQTNSSASSTFATATAEPNRTAAFYQASSTTGAAEAPSGYGSTAGFGSGQGTTTGPGAAISSSYEAGMRGSTGSTQNANRRSGRAFDSTSRHRSGAYTRVSPSALSKLGRPDADKMGKMSGLEAFMTGAGQRLKNDFKHRVVDGKKGFAGVDGNGRGNRTLWGVMSEELGKAREDMQSSELLKNGLVPRDELLSDWSNGDPLAGEALREIEHEQLNMNQAVVWLDDADAMEATILPEHQEAELEYNNAEAEYQHISTVLLEMRARGMTNGPEYQKAIEQQDATKTRRDQAEENFKIRGTELTQIGELRQRATTQIESARSRIYSLNMGYNPANARQRDIETAVRRAGRRTFSDLY